MAPPEEWVSPFVFYLNIILYSIRRLLRMLYDVIFHSKKFKNENKIQMRPKCLSAPENGIQQYAKLHRTKLHYVERGSPSQPLLLLLHGFPEFWYSWRYQLRSLSENFWVVAVDLKGFGDSDKPKYRSEYDIPVLVDEIRGLLTAIGTGDRKCTIVSHGLGGLVAWHFLNEHPDLIENFISIASPHPVSFLQELNAGRVGCKNWYYSTPLPFVPEKDCLKQDLKIFDTVFRDFLKQRNRNMSLQDLQAYKYTFSRYEDWIGPLNYFRTLLLRQSKYSKKFRKSNVPVYFIVGNKDPYCTLEMICKSSEYVENFTLKIVEDAGHYVNQEMPNYVNSLIENFMKRGQNDGFGNGDEHPDKSILRKVFGAGRNVMTSTVNYGNHFLGIEPKSHLLLNATSKDAGSS